MSEKTLKEQPDTLNAPPAELVSAMAADAGIGVSIDPVESREDEMPDPLSGIAFGLPVIEKFLLSIIDAYPLEGGDRRSRLETAMEALINQKASPGPLPQDPHKNWREQEVIVESALLWMGNEYASASRRKPSDRALATAAADTFFPTVSAERRNSRIDDLRARFSGNYDKKLKHWNASHPTDVRRTYVYRASQHDYVRESVEHQVLRRVRDAFAATGLRMILPDE